FLENLEESQIFDSTYHSRGQKTESEVIPVAADVTWMNCVLMDAMLAERRYEINQEEEEECRDAALSFGDNDRESGCDEEFDLRCDSKQKSCST
ncbi:unnamed protein product, partial [Didymodactylos carnosus]